MSETPSVPSTSTSNPPTPTAAGSSPKGRWLSGHGRAFRADPLGFLTACAREHGGLVPLRFGVRSVVLLVSDPSLVRDLLDRTRAGHLSDADNPFQRTQFRESEPSGVGEAAGRTAEIVARIEWATQDWRVGQTRDVWAEMNDLASEIFDDAPSRGEATANALAWAWQLLARDPEMDAAVWDESLRIVGERRPKAEDVDRLRLTQSVITETFRLFPPRWLVRLKVIGDSRKGLTIADRRASVGSEIWISPWVLHRDPERYPDPEGFLPERWDNDSPDPRTTASADNERSPWFLPFGPKLTLDIDEPQIREVAALTLTTLCRRFRFALDIGWKQPRPKPDVLLRPDNGVQIILKSRSERWGR